MIFILVILIRLKVSQKTQHDIEDYEDDQLYYTKNFIKQRENNLVKLDYDNILFFCLSGVENLIKTDVGSQSIFYYDTRPCFIHGNGGHSTKLFFNNIITNTCFGSNKVYGNDRINKKVDKNWQQNLKDFKIERSIGWKLAIKKIHQAAL